MKILMAAILATSLFLTSLMLGCKQNSDIFIPDEIHPWDTLQVSGNINDFHALVKPASEHFILDAGVKNVFRTQKGTLITIQENALKNDTTVAGLVDLEFLEFYNKGSMILTDRPTQTRSGNLLESDGVFYINFTQDSQQLELYGNKPITVQFQNANPDPAMLLFGGGDFPGGNFRWWDIGFPIISPGTWQDTLIPPPPPAVTGYIFNTTNLTWLNCDVPLYIPAPLLTKVCVQLPPQFVNLNARVYIVFKNRNSIMNLWGDPGLLSFCAEKVPLGEEVVFVAIGVQGTERYFFKQQQVAITAGMNIELTPVETPLDDILNFLDDL
jgi:hypothetical protein